jgi:hypothetical protein
VKTSLGVLDVPVFLPKNIQCCVILVAPFFKKKIFVQKWQVYVDQSKSSLALGASATLDAFFGLCSSTSFDPNNDGDNVPFVQVIPAEFKSKHKGPVVRCISNDDKNADSFEVSNVDSVDKVYRILTRHMKVPVRFVVTQANELSSHDHENENLWIGIVAGYFQENVRVLKMEVQGQWSFRGGSSRICH